MIFSNPNVAANRTMANVTGIQRSLKLMNEKSYRKCKQYVEKRQQSIRQQGRNCHSQDAIFRDNDQTQYHEQRRYDSLDGRSCGLVVHPCENQRGGKTGELQDNHP